MEYIAHRAVLGCQEVTLYICPEFYASKEEELLNRFRHTARSLAENFSPAMAEALDECEEELAAMGYDWEQIEEMEIEALRMAQEEVR